MSKRQRTGGSSSCSSSSSSSAATAPPSSLSSSSRSLSTAAAASGGNAAAETAEGKKKSGGGQEEEKKAKGGIPWFGIFLNTCIPLAIYGGLKRRARDPKEEEAADKISIHRNEMAYLIRNTKFTAAELVWIQGYAQKFFKQGYAQPDQWGMFVAWILKELNRHRGEPDSGKGDPKKEKKLDNFDALLMYRESPTVTRNIMGLQVEVIPLSELLSGLSVLAIDEVPLHPEGSRQRKKNEPVQMKEDPWAKFSLAWTLQDSDRDGELTRDEFEVFCNRLIRFGYIRADALAFQTTNFPFPPKFEVLTGKKIADMYWEALGNDSSKTISREIFERETASLERCEYLHFWHLDWDQTGFFSGIWKKWNEIYRRSQRSKALKEKS